MEAEPERSNTNKLRKKMKQQNMEESWNDVTDLEYENRPRSPIKRTEDQMQKWHRPSRVVRRSDTPNKGVKSHRFKEV